MNTYRIFPEEKQEKAVEIGKKLVPEGGELVLLSYTGGRAFGWGMEYHDWDVHGWFAKPEGVYHKIHAAENGFDLTIRNIEDVEDPDIRYDRWKKYYDLSNPIYIHDDFDYQDYYNHLEPEIISQIYPFDVRLQIARMEHQFHARSVLHTYKEMLIPLNYLYYDEIETNVLEINKKPRFQFDGVVKADEAYSRHSNVDIKEYKDLVWDEIQELFIALGEAIPFEEPPDEAKDLKERMRTLGYLE